METYIQVLSKEIDEQERKFKETSSLAQTLVKKANPDRDLLANLQQIREQIITVRKDASEKRRSLNELPPKVEELENGLMEIGEWLDEGDYFLASHRIEGNIDKVEEGYEAHMVSSLLVLVIVFKMVG